ncbi:MAG: hypothetical protein ACE5J1_05515, partial [Nitrospiria bacterium]
APFSYELLPGPLIIRREELFRNVLQTTYLRKRLEIIIFHVRRGRVFSVLSHNEKYFVGLAK